MVTCGIMPVRHRDIIGDREDNYLPECILPHDRTCPCLIKTPEGRYFQWEDDDDCGCCPPEEDDRCYLYWEVTKEKAEELLQGRG